MILKYNKVLCHDILDLEKTAIAAYIKTTPNKFGRMCSYWGGESFVRLLEAITMHPIFVIQDSKYQNISSVSDDQFSVGVCYNDSVAMRVLKTPKFRPL